MIFVTVGTHTQSFNRLLKEVDMLKKEGDIKEKVVAQIGHSSYEPEEIEWFRFTSFKELNKLYKNARIIIAHGGAGSILNGLSNKKSVIAVPRLEKFDEHVNDHQIDIVKKLEKKGRIAVVYDIKNLKRAIISTKKGKKIRTESKICDDIKKFLVDMRR